MMNQFFRDFSTYCRKSRDGFCSSVCVDYVTGRWAGQGPDVTRKASATSSGWRSRPSLRPLMGPVLGTRNIPPHVSVAPRSYLRLNVRPPGTPILDLPGWSIAFANEKRRQESKQ